MEVVVGLLALAVTIFGIRVAYRQNSAAESAAKRELSGRHNLSLALNGTDARDIIWVLPWQKHKRLYILDFELSLHNTDVKDLEEVFLMVEVPSDLYGPDVPREFQSELRIVKMENYSDPVDGRELTRITYCLNKVQPGVRIVLRDFICVGTESRLVSSVEAVSKDGVPVQVGYTMVYGREFNLTLVATNIQPMRKRFSLYTFDPGDPYVAHLKEPPKEVLSKVMSSGVDWKKTRSAKVFFVDEPELDPLDLPADLRGRFARVELKGLSTMMATWLPKFGYVPFKMNASRPPGRTPWLATWFKRSKPR